ncbi:MAG TPA: hypothetical protein VJZ71_00720 [Phycisphaerae bacterium]|nr:hypothetical protein [Phycisphaerae bacterium]
MSFSTCPYCKAAGLIEGTLQSTGTLHFRPGGVKFLTFRTADIGVSSFMCPDCGGITIKGNTQKLELVQQTKGRQTVPQTVG